MYWLVGGLRGLERGIGEEMRQKNLEKARRYARRHDGDRFPRLIRVRDRSLPYYSGIYQTAASSMFAWAVVVVLSSLSFSSLLVCRKESFFVTENSQDGFLARIKVGLLTNFGGGIAHISYHVATNIREDSFLQLSLIRRWFLPFVSEFFL